MTTDAWAHHLIEEHGPSAADYVRDCLKQSDWTRDKATTKFGDELLQIIDQFQIEQG